MTHTHLDRLLGAPHCCGSRRPAALRSAQLEVAHRLRGSRQHAALEPDKGEGFENKIAQVIGKALGTGVQLLLAALDRARAHAHARLSEGNCDLWMDMASDTEGAVVLPMPLYRSTFVLAYRNDKGIDIKSLRRSDVEETAGGRVPGLRDPRGSLRARCRQQYRGSLPQPQRRHWSARTNPRTRCSKSSTARSMSLRPGVRWRDTTRR